MESGICSGTAGAVASSGEVRAKSRRATYPAAINLARLAVMLAARGAGNVVRFDEIETHLRCLRSDAVPLRRRAACGVCRR